MNSLNLNFSMWVPALVAMSILRCECYMQKKMYLVTIGQLTSPLLRIYFFLGNAFNVLISVQT